MRIVFVIWLLAVGSSAGFLISYTSQAGKLGDAPRNWPQVEGFEYRNDKPTLVMLVHPSCSCSKSSIRELERILARFQNAVHAYIFFYASRANESWKNSDIWKQARVIKGVSLIEDGDGGRARLFDSHTSGQVVLYDTKGNLVFSGGITAGRGHEGKSRGGERLEQFLSTGIVDRATAPVFGCDIFGESV